MLQLFYLGNRIFITEVRKTLGEIGATVADVARRGGNYSGQSGEELYPLYGR